MCEKALIEEQEHWEERIKQIRNLMYRELLHVWLWVTQNELLCCAGFSVMAQQLSRKSKTAFFQFFWSWMYPSIVLLTDDRRGRWVKWILGNLSEFISINMRQIVSIQMSSFITSVSFCQMIFSTLWTFKYQKNIFY